jgi:hypothetical protein
LSIRRQKRIIQRSERTILSNNLFYLKIKGEALANLNPVLSEIKTKTEKRRRGTVISVNPSHHDPSSKAPPPPQAPRLSPARFLYLQSFPVVYPLSFFIWNKN